MGSADLALKEFNDYLQLYGDTARAQDVQFYIGQIHFDQKDWPNALKDFDAVLERYSTATNDSKTPDALLMKGRTLVRWIGRPTARKEFRALLTKYPSHPLAKSACSELKALGFSCDAAAAQKKNPRMNGAHLLWSATGRTAP